MVNKPTTPHKTPTKAALQKEAQLEHERLNALINSMADAVIAVDEHQKVVIYNGAALNILDVNKELKGQHLRHIITIIDKNGKKIDIETMVQRVQTQFTSRDIRLKYPDGETINLYVSIAPVHLGYAIKGHRGHVILLRDITREKSLEEERDEFISVVSHELRTPIAIAEANISNAQFMIERQGADSVPDIINTSLKSSYDQVVFLANMINDLATLSRAERGKLTAEVEPINANELVQELRRTYVQQAEDKGLKLTAKADPHLEILKSSKLYVREVLQNFITNSIKYTEKGSVHIEAHNKKDGVLFEVSDTGIGISKADKEKVFDKFFRSEDYRTRQNSGTGLGLYVTMKLARLVHAELEVTTELDKGSTFSVFFPNLEG